MEERRTPPSHRFSKGKKGRKGDSVSDIKSENSPRSTSFTQAQHGLGESHSFARKLPLGESPSTGSWARSFSFISNPKTKVLHRRPSQASRTSSAKKTSSSKKFMPTSSQTLAPKFSRRGSFLPLPFRSSKLSVKEESFQCKVCNKIVGFDQGTTVHGHHIHYECMRCRDCGMDQRFSMAQAVIINQANGLIQIVCANCSLKSKKGVQKLLGSALYGSGHFNVMRGRRKQPRVASILSFFPGVPEQSGELSSENLVERIQVMKASKEFFPSAMMKAFDAAKYEEMILEDQQRFVHVVESGIDYPDSVCGAYVISKDDLDDFDWFFDPLVREAHGVSEFVKTLGTSNFKDQHLYRNVIRKTHFIEDTSESVKIVKLSFIRNIDGFDLVGAMTVEERREVEQLLKEVFIYLSRNAGYGGTTVSLSNVKMPENQYSMPGRNKQNGDMPASLVGYNKEYSKIDPLSQKGFLKQDRFLKNTKIVENWGIGSGAYVTSDKAIRVNYNHEDHLEFTLCTTATNRSLNDMYKTLRDFLVAFEDAFEKIYKTPIRYHVHKKYGFVTTCPTNLGSGFKATATVSIPALLENGKLKSNLKDYELMVRKFPYSHNVESSRRKGTIHGAMEPVQRDPTDGLAEVYPIRRLFDREETILANLADKVPRLLAEEIKDRQYV